MNMEAGERWWEEVEREREIIESSAIAEDNRANSEQRVGGNVCSTPVVSHSASCFGLEILF